MKLSLAAVFALVFFGLSSCRMDVIDPVSPQASASGRLSASASASYRGIYVDGFSGILGNSSREDSLLNWCVRNNINTISLYDLNSIMNDERYGTLAGFVQKARVSYGIREVTAVRGSSANFMQNVRYDASRGNLNERFTTYNLENEWWNNGPSCNFSCYTTILETMSKAARSATPRITAEAYMGWFQNPSGRELQQAKTLVRWLDRILVHDYRPYPQFSYMQSRLSYLSRAAQSQNRVIDVIVLFSAEPEFMQDYFSVAGRNNSFADAYNDIVSQFEAAGFANSNVRLIGYQIYNYSWAKKAKPTYITLM